MFRNIGGDAAMLPLQFVVAVGSIAIVFGQRNALVHQALHARAAFAGLVAFAVLGSVFSLREVSDRFVYIDLFQNAALLQSPWKYSTLDAPLFALYVWVLAHVSPSSTWLVFAFTALTLCVCYIWAARQVLPSWAAIGAFATIVASGLLEGYGAIALKQGMAISLLLVGCSLYSRSPEKRGHILLVAVGAVLFHWSALWPAASLVLLTYFSPRLRTVVVVWGALAVGFLADVQGSLLRGVSPYLPQIAEYSSSGTFEAYGSTGNRIDFFAVSGLIMISALLARKVVSHSDSTDTAIYDRLIMAYAMFNGFFLLLGFIAFSDRLAAYSWFLMPLLFWFPLSRIHRPVMSGVLLISVYVFGVFSGTFNSILAL